MRTIVASLAAAAVLLLGAPAATASARDAGATSSPFVPADDDARYSAAGCPTRTTSRLLARFGDRNLYFEVPNGSFGALGEGWTGTYLLSYQNEPWKVSQTSDSFSLALFPGQHAASDPLCLSAGEESVRFFYRGTGEEDSRLTVRVTIQADTGTFVQTVDLDASVPNWRLSPSLAVPDRSTTGAQQVTLEFLNTSTSPSTLPVLVDDVLVDPWRSRGW